MSAEPTPLARAVRALRRRLGLTQRAFASRLAVPQSSVYRWEAAVVTPSGRHLKALHELAELHGFGFQPFSDEVAVAHPPAAGALDEAVMRLVREQVVFCEAIESQAATEEGAEVWKLLGSTLTAQRRKLSRFLEEADTGAAADFNFWKAVSVLKVFSWRDPVRDPEAPSYVRREQMRASPDGFGGEGP